MLVILKSKYFVVFFLLVCLFCFWAVPLLADQTVTTTTSAPASTTQVKEVKVVEKDESSIVGNFFRFVGDVIAFPFRMVGKALDAIF